MILQSDWNEPVDINGPEAKKTPAPAVVKKKSAAAEAEPDQQIKMLCEMHGAPAAFFSQKENRYVCFKCLVSSEQLLYIDKSYKSEMEDFERIKSITEEAMKTNVKNTTIIHNWRR